MNEENKPQNLESSSDVLDMLSQLGVNNDESIMSKEISASSLINSNSEIKKDINELGLDSNVLDMLSQLGVGTSDSVTYNVDVDSSEENIEIVPEIKIDTNIDEPNIIIKKSELVKVLRFASVMIKKMTNDIEASSVNITYVDEGKVLYRLKDNMTYVEIEGTCDVANNKPYTKTLSFRVDYLAKLLSTAAETFLLYEGDSVDTKGENKKVVFARVINGDMIIDVFNGNESKLVLPGTKDKLLLEVPSHNISTLCDTMTPLISDTQEINSKRAILYQDRAFFRSITYLLQYKGTFDNMHLGKKELDLLKLVSSLYKSENISIYTVNSNGENRILIIAPNIKISTSISIPNRDEVIIARLNELENAKYMKIDKNDLKRVLFLSSIGSNNVAKVTMNYNIDNQGIDAKIIGRDGNSGFLIKGDNYNNLEPRSEEIAIYVPPIITLLKSFESGKELQIAFLNNGVAFKDDTIGIEAIMNYAR